MESWQECSSIKWMNEWMFNVTPARKTDWLLGVRKRLLLYQDNVPVHTSTVAIQKCGFQLVNDWMNECLTTPQHEKQIGYWVSEKGKCMKWSNLSKTHPILLIWLPPTTTSSQKMQKELGSHHFARDDDDMNALDHFLMDSNDAFYICRCICSITTGLSVLMYGRTMLKNGCIWFSKTDSF